MNRRDVLRAAGTVPLAVGGSVAGVASVSAAQDAFDDGDGTADDPYRIATPEQFLAIHDSSGGHYRLVDDLDFDGVVIEPLYALEGLDGNGHEIVNVEIDTGTGRGTGLFWRIGWDVTVTDLDLVDVSVSAPENEPVGALAAELRGTVSDVSVDGEVTGVNEVGGVVGKFTEGSMSNVSFEGAVSGNAAVGGLVGNIADSVSGERTTVENASTSGTVDAAGNGGGLVGHVNVFSEIRAVESDCDVSTEGRAGGLIGRMAGGTVTDATASGDVSGADSIGGLVGQVIRDCPITGSVATGTVDGSQWVGGLVGRNRGQITECVAVGDVSGADRVGGLVGLNELGGEIEVAFATGDVDGEQDVGGLIGKQTVNADVAHAYARGSVTGVDTVGGLIGEFTDTTATETYAAGPVTGDASVGGLLGSRDEFGTVENSYWDAGLEHDHPSAGDEPLRTIGEDDEGDAGLDDAAGLDTEEMTGENARAKFVGWDFDHRWATTDSYPTLRTLDELVPERRGTDEAVSDDGNGDRETENGDDEADDRSEDDALPGFGPVSAIVASGLGYALVRRIESKSRQ